MHQIPSLVRLDVFEVGRHRCSIETCHENTVKVPVGLAALEALARGEVVGHDGALLAVGECGGGRPVPSPLLAMALPALQLLVELFAAPNALGSLRRLLWDRHRSGGLLLVEAR